jgi:hypothetical protein
MVLHLSLTLSLCLLSERNHMPGGGGGSFVKRGSGIVSASYTRKGISKATNYTYLIGKKNHAIELKYVTVIRTATGCLL